MVHHRFWLSIVVGLLLTAAFGAALSTAKGPARLDNADCQKCHVRESLAIAERGMAHQTAVTCQSCHEGHRPLQAENIPACALCHSGSAHYELSNCRGCHDPHAPMEIELQGDIVDVCLSCHAQQGEELAAQPSLHSDLSCTTCHSGRHRAETQCSSCHAPHGPAMVEADCRLCHQAHMPTVLNYGDATPAVHCVACHQQAGEVWAASPTRHSEVACTSCHPQRHGSIAACADCHGAPHAPGMHERFPRCGDCHGTAHDLISGGSR